MTRASWAGKVIFTSLFVYLAMAMDLPNWALRAIDKSEGASCGEEGRRQEVVIVWLHGWWFAVPRSSKGLGILDLKLVVGHGCDGYGCIKPNRINLGTRYTILVHPCIKALFSTAIISVVGDGRNTLFCMDGWRGSPLLILLCTFLPLSLKHRGIGLIAIQFMMHWWDVVGCRIFKVLSWWLLIRIFKYMGSCVRSGDPEWHSR